VLRLISRTFRALILVGALFGGSGLASSHPASRALPPFARSLAELSAASVSAAPLPSSPATGTVPTPRAAARRRPTVPVRSPSAARTGAARAIALTFDDGYNSRNVNRVIDTLLADNVRATFFPVGSWVQRDPATFTRMAARFEVGNHTFSHPFLTHLSDAAVRWEVRNGVHASLFRPPFGDIDPRVRGIVRSLGYRVVLWDVDSRDWTGITPAQEVANVVSNAGPGKIVLMHMGDSNTVQALPQIIAQLRARGYVFDTVSQIVGLRPPGSLAAGNRASRGPAV
jgi:peptidoglycan-N-acetylglucosamine deacetylase